MWLPSLEIRYLVSFLGVGFLSESDLLNGEHSKRTPKLTTQNTENWWSLIRLTVRIEQRKFRSNCDFSVACTDVESTSDVRQSYIEPAAHGTGHMMIDECESESNDV